MQTLTSQLYVTNMVHMRGCKAAQATFQPEETKDRNSKHCYSAQVACRTEKDEAGWETVCAR